MTTAIEKQASSEEAAAKATGVVPPSALSLASELTLRAVCVDRQTGEILHNLKLLEVDEPNSIHSLNSYASPTPVVEQGRLYCHFGRYGTVCVNTLDQSIVWQRKFEIEHYVGPGSSPVVCGDLLVLTCDGADQQYIAAVDKATGDTRWKVDRPPIRADNPDFRKSYCTPLVIQQSGRQEIIIPGAQWIIGYAPADGREIWKVDHGSGFSVVPRPVADQQHLFCCTGFTGAGVMAIRRGGTGDVSKSHVMWTHRQQAPTQPSPVLADGKLFIVSDSGIAQCLDTSDAAVLWKKRMPSDYSASPLLIGEHVYFFSRDGDTVVVDLNGKGERVAESKLADGIMATPAVVGDELLVRTETHLYAISESESPNRAE